MYFQLTKHRIALRIDDFPFRLFGGARALWRVCTGRDVLDFFKTHLQDVALNDDWRSPLQKKSMIKFSVPVGAVSLSQTYFMMFFFLNLEVNSFSKVIWRFIFLAIRREGVLFAASEKFNQPKELWRRDSWAAVVMLLFLGNILEILVRCRCKL